MDNVVKILSKAVVDKGLVTQEEVSLLLKETKNNIKDFIFNLTTRGQITEDKILQILSKELGIEYIDLGEFRIDSSVAKKVPLKFTSYYKFMPIKIEKNNLTIATASPLDTKTQDEIRTHLGHQIKVVLATENDISEKLKIHYGLGADTVQKIILKEPESVSGKDFGDFGDNSIEDIAKLAEEASVIRLVNQIILEAYRRRATDIHIEPYRSKVKLRYRIDGILYDAPVPAETVNFFSAILSRIKIMSNLNIVERRLPQDGRAVVKIQDQTLDLRVSSLPTPYGESIVIRILPTRMLFSIVKLGLSSVDLASFRNLIKKPHGIILVTGPTGSGKTTTLYACLSEINTVERKIITIEDPIEYEIDDLTQVQVFPEIGLSFSRGLRSMLRHDPDVMMVGEIRDRETADIAIRVALTGHLVFSTLHTNDAASGVTRLIDIGLEAYLVASSVEAFIAQRLVRLICPNCKVEDNSHSDQLKLQIARDLGIASLEGLKLYKGKGCKDCGGTGFYGRVAIYEILLVDDAIKELILKKVSSGEIKRVAIQRGMRTLRQDGWKKVLAGLTTVEQIMEVTSAREKQSMKEFLNTKGCTPESSTEIHRDDNPPEESKESNFNERRAYKRLKADVNMSFNLIKPKDRAERNKYVIDQFTISKNISAGGLLFVSGEAFPIGSVLRLKIDLPDTQKSIECSARVLRAEELEANKSYSIGACFLDISSADRVRFNRYVEI